MVVIIMNTGTLDTHTPGSDLIEQANFKIMVVDDDPIVLCVLAEVLNKSGYIVDVFNDSREAYKAFDEFVFDLVVADWKMPGLDGLSLIAVFKERCPQLPAILITSYGDAEDVHQALESGLVEAVFHKPFDVRYFIETLSSIVISKGHYQQPSSDSLFETVCDHTAISNTSRVMDNWSDQISRGLYYKEILESITDTVIMVNSEGQIIYFNAGACRMFGFNEQEASDVYLDRLCGIESQVHDIVARFFGLHLPVAEQHEGYFKRIGGDEFYCAFSVSLFDSVYQERSVLLSIKDIDERHIMEQRTSDKAQDLEIIATTDSLTGLYNRLYFDRRLEEEYKRSVRYGSVLSLIMLDFDHFKLINDIFGHQTGDKVLIAAAWELSLGLRETDILSRWGGEEFMVMLPETELETAVTVARRLHFCILDSPTWATLDPELQVTISMGMVSFPWPGQKPSLTEVTTCLDKTLYRAKETGRNKIVVYKHATDSFEDV